MQAHLENAIGGALDRGWLLSWQAVRRRLNQTADRLVTRGVMWAARMRDSGRAMMAVSTRWF